MGSWEKNAPRVKFKIAGNFSERVNIQIINFLVLHFYGDLFGGWLSPIIFQRLKTNG
jgi:hypothetical protein